jgi:phage terminase Nu1 subunit (DNA packaging protein)
MTIRHLNQSELAKRWSLSTRTLERWRWQRQGPPFLKVGGRVVYRLEDVESYEARQLRQRDAAEPIEGVTST